MVAMNTANLLTEQDGTANLKMQTAVSKIVAGATSLSLRNNADTQDNLIVLDSGNTTVRGTLTSTGGLTVTGGGLTITSGTLTVTAGEIKASAGSISNGAVSALQTGAGNGETINTTSIGTARYIAVAARTGVILQSGTYDGQTVIVINEDTTAANSITFAAVATSHVANGVTTVINGLTGKRFVWSASAATPAWYAC